MRQIVSVCGALIVAAALTPAVAGAADAREGEALYVGATRLQNGGAPCLGCHGLAGHGLAWSASFGPDLSAAAQTYDVETLATVLEDVPFPSMEPIYRGHAITAGEREDLAAFLLEARAPAAPGDARGRILAEAGLVAGAILALLYVLFRRRMPPVSAALAPARRTEGGTR